MSSECRDGNISIYSYVSLCFLIIEEYSGHLKRAVSSLGQQAENSRCGMALPSISRLSSKRMIQPSVPWPLLTLVPTLHLQTRVVSSSILSLTWTTSPRGKAHRRERLSEGWVSVQTIDVLRPPAMIRACGYGHLQKVEWRVCWPVRFWKPCVLKVTLLILNHRSRLGREMCRMASY